jgi:hypothetical protein
MTTVFGKRIEKNLEAAIFANVAVNARKPDPLDRHVPGVLPGLWADAKASCRSAGKRWDRIPVLFEGEAVRNRSRCNHARRVSVQLREGSKAAMSTSEL